jgi:hypothetical protein
MVLHMGWIHQMARSTSEFRDDLICRAFNDLEFVGEEQSAAIKSHVIIWT